MVHRILLGLLALLSLAVSFSYLGHLHPAGDSLAVFRPWLIGALVVALLAMLAVRPHRMVGQALLVIVLLVAGKVLLLPPPAGGPVVVTSYQKNLSFRLADPSAVVEDILAAAPDVITLQEVDKDNRAVLAALSEAYPNQHICPFHTIVGDTAVLSRYPVIEGSRRCAEGGFTAFRVMAPNGPLWVVSIHLHWPWPYRQAQHLEALADDLAALQGPVLIGGDFNMVPGSHALRRITALTGSHVQPGAPATYHLEGWVGVPIDHVLYPTPCGTVSRRAKLGSDHHGILARLVSGCEPGAID